MKKQPFLILLIFAVFSFGGPVLAASKGPEVSTRGYSIFEGTMADMTYPQIEKAAKEKAIVLFPTGVIEEHGPAMPLGTDTYEAYINAKLVKAQLEKKGIQTLIAPPFYWGINSETGSFGGSFHSREETVISVLWDAMASLKRWGFENVFFVNQHNGADHIRAILRAVQKARVDTGIRAYFILDGGLAKRLGFTGKEPYILIPKSTPQPPSKYVEVHAGGREMSMMWYYFPELVDLEIWKTLKSTDLTSQDLDVWRRGWEEARKVMPQGFFGDPTTATLEGGKNSMEEIGKRFAELIEVFLKGEYQPPEMK
jgi:creatinine amidohydrolase